MDLGVIQQIGTPLDLYYRPANLFVAAFIGEPPMNLVHCRLNLSEGNLKLVWQNNGPVVWHYVAMNIPPQALQALKSYHEREIVVGVRPQRLLLGPALTGQDDGALAAQLLVHEFLGKEGIAQVQLDHTVLECITPPVVPFNPGDLVSVSAAFEDLHFFDPESTRRIIY